MDSGWNGLGVPGNKGDEIPGSGSGLYAAEFRSAAFGGRAWVLRDYVRRRGAGEPLQYITGEVAFRHINVKVRPGVLIPRPETEVLVSEVRLALPTPGPRDVAWNPEAAEQEREAVAAVKKALEEAGESASSRRGDLRPRLRMTTNANE